MAFSTQCITDLTTVVTNGPATNSSTNANAIAAAGGPANQPLAITGGSGNYATATFYGGIMDYPGAIKACILKLQEVANLLTRIITDTDGTNDSTNYALLVKVLNDMQ